MNLSYFINSEFAKQSKFNYDFVGNMIKTDQWLLLAKQYDQYLNKKAAKEVKAQLIPKKIHQIWLGNKKLPNRYKKWMNSWKLYNKDWDYKLWNEENIKELDIHNLDLYSNKMNPGFRSDIIRYIILKTFGGIYIDTDFECLKSIPHDLLRYKFVSCTIFDYHPVIANGMMMCCPDYVLVNKILDTINIKNYNNNINDILNNSGPNRLTRVYFDSFNYINKESIILPSNYFYPYPNFMLNNSNNRYGEIVNISIGIHHWEMSWMKGNILNRITKKIQKYLHKTLKILSKRYT